MKPYHGAPNNNNQFYLVYLSVLNKCQTTVNRYIEYKLIKYIQDIYCQIHHQTKSLQFKYLIIKSETIV